MLVGFTIALIAFTPLKFYIPGYGAAGKTQQFETLKVKADSIEHSLVIKQQYIDDMEKILKGNTVPMDTTTLKISRMTKILFQKRENKKKTQIIIINLYSRQTTLILNPKPLNSHSSTLINRKESNRQLMRYAGLGAQFLLAIALGVFMGLKVDEWLKFSFPLLVWLLPLLIIIGMLIKIIKDTDKNE